MRKVAVFFGGKSSEREISVLTGVFVLNVLDRTKYDILPVYIGEDGGYYTSEKMYSIEAFKGGRYAFKRLFFDHGRAYVWEKEGKKSRCTGEIEVALNCCHGGVGEGGGVSALCLLQGWANASPAVAPCAVALDKSLTKLVAKGLGIATLDAVRVEEGDYRKRGKFLLKTVGLRLKYPVIVKPVSQGSSIGVSVATDEKQLQAALESAFALDAVALVEKYLADKKDVNCAAYRLQGEIILSEAEIANAEEGVYDFDKKYLQGGDFLKGGGRTTIGGKVREKIRQATKLLYKRLAMTGVVRFDFLLGGDGDVYLSEINAVPGSLAYYLFCERLSDARTFFSDLIEEGVLAQAREKKQSLSAGVLSALTVRRK